MIVARRILEGYMSSVIEVISGEVGIGWYLLSGILVESFKL